MGKLSKGFNKKARQKSTQSIEDLQRSSSELAKLVELKDSEEYKSTRDESNVLILSTKRLPSKKVISLKEKKTKKLTKKQKKKLLQIVDQKKKKEQVTTFEFLFFSTLNFVFSITFIKEQCLMLYKRNKIYKMHALFTLLNICVKTPNNSYIFSFKIISCFLTGE